MFKKLSLRMWISTIIIASLLNIVFGDYSLQRANEKERASYLMLSNRYRPDICNSRGVTDALLPLKKTDDFIRCHQKDAKLNDCLKSAVPIALRKMKNGIPSLEVPSMEPLLVDKVSIGTGAGPVVINMNYRNIKLLGLTDSNLTTYKADLNHYRIRTNSLTPRMQFIGDYEMKGQILVLPIHGKGVANITMINLVVKHDLIGEPVVREGETYMHMRDYKVRFIPQKVILYFSNLFDGDKRLGDQMNIFLNENSEIVFNELKESCEKSLGSVFHDMTNKIFDKVPMNKIFLED